MPSMIAIVHSIYSQSVHAPASHAGLMDSEAELYCRWGIVDTVACVEYIYIFHNIKRYYARWMICL